MFEKTRSLSPKPTIRNNDYISAYNVMSEFTAPDHFEVGEVLRNNGGITRFPVLSKNVSNDTDVLFFLPDIDKITIKTTSPFFATLEENGITSPLIELFAERERAGLPFRIEGRKYDLLRCDKYLMPIDPSELKTGLEVESATKPIYLYNLAEGGIPIFQLIHNLDEKFWAMLLRGVRRIKSISLTEIDLALDFNYDLLPYIANCLQKGYYQVNNSKLRVYGELNGSKLENYSWAKRGKEFQSQKEKKLLLYTLYVGNKQSSSLIVCIYNKRQEELTRKNELSNVETRIEVGFRSRCSDQDFFDSLVKAVTSYREPESLYILTEFFYRGLCETIIFTNKYESDFLDPNRKGSIAPWYMKYVLWPFAYLLR